MHVGNVEGFQNRLLPAIPHHQILVAVDLDLCVGRDCSELWLRASHSGHTCVAAPSLSIIQSMMSLCRTCPDVQVSAVIGN